MHLVLLSIISLHLATSADCKSLSNDLAIKQDNNLRYKRHTAIEEQIATSYMKRLKDGINDVFKKLVLDQPVNSTFKYGDFFLKGDSVSGIENMKYVGKNETKVPDGEAYDFTYKIPTITIQYTFDVSIKTFGNIKGKYIVNIKEQTVIKRTILETSYVGGWCFSDGGMKFKLDVTGLTTDFKPDDKDLEKRMCEWGNITITKYITEIFTPILETELIRTIQEITININGTGPLPTDAPATPPAPTKPQPPQPGQTEPPAPTNPQPPQPGHTEPPAPTNPQPPQPGHTEPPAPTNPQPPQPGHTEPPATPPAPTEPQPPPPGSVKPQTPPTELESTDWILPSITPPPGVPTIPTGVCSTVSGWPKCKHDDYANCFLYQLKSHVLGRSTVVNEISVPYCADGAYGTLSIVCVHALLDWEVLYEGYTIVEGNPMSEITYNFAVQKITIPMQFSMSIVDESNTTVCVSGGVETQLMKQPIEIKVRSCQAANGTCHYEITEIRFLMNRDCFTSYFSVNQYTAADTAMQNRAIKWVNTYIYQRLLTKFVFHKIQDSFFTAHTVIG